jgi:hypothetical protein
VIDVLVMFRLSTKLDFASTEPKPNDALTDPETFNALRNELTS